MAGRVQVKHRRHSEDLRKVAVHNSMWNRQDSLSRVNSSNSESQTASRSATSIPPLYNMKDLRRRTVATFDMPLLIPRQPSRDRQRLCSPTRRSNPHPAGFAYQRPYNRHHKGYDIWNPCQDVKPSPPGAMLHTKEVNFTCSYKYKRPDVLPVQKSAPEMHKSWPIIYLQAFVNKRPTQLPAIGIAPNVLARESNERPRSASLGGVRPKANQNQNISLPDQEAGKPIKQDLSR